MANLASAPELIKRSVAAGPADKSCEVATLVGVLCSADAGYIGGQVIGINRGMA